MLIYENAPKSIYEEIKTWYPLWYRDVLEMDALWRTWGNRLEEIQTGIIRSIDNNFIDYADAETISRIEKAFGISHEGPRSILERRNVLKAAFSNSGHIGRREIKSLISMLNSGEEMEISVSLIAGAIEISVNREWGSSFNLYDAHVVLDHRIPAHLALSLVDITHPVIALNKNWIELIDISFNFRLKNPTAETEYPILDGNLDLDGSWLLNSKKARLALSDFAFSVRETNSSHVNFYGLDLLTSLQNDSQISAERVDFSAYSLHNENRISGKMYIEGTGKLNGEFNLDGSQVLDGNYILEEL